MRSTWNKKGITRPTKPPPTHRPSDPYDDFGHSKPEAKLKDDLSPSWSAEPGKALARLSPKGGLGRSPNAGLSPSSKHHFSPSHGAGAALLSPAARNGAGALLSPSSSGSGGFGVGALLLPGSGAVGKGSASPRGGAITSPSSRGATPIAGAAASLLSPSGLHQRSPKGAALADFAMKPSPKSSLGGSGGAGGVFGSEVGGFQKGPSAA